jgi:LAGLIDADG DNA endonuclease family
LWYFFIFFLVSIINLVQLNALGFLMYNFNFNNFNSGSENSGSQNYDSSYFSSNNLDPQDNNDLDPQEEKSLDKYSKLYKKGIKVTPFISEALIGLLLGDLHGVRTKPTHNTRFVFDQSKNLHSEYINYLYELFIMFVATPPKSSNRKPDPRTEKFMIV